MHVHGLVNLNCHLDDSVLRPQEDISDAIMRRSEPQPPKYLSCTHCIGSMHDVSVCPRHGA